MTTSTVDRTLGGPAAITLDGRGTRSPHQYILTLLAGKMIASVICTLAQVGVADHLAAGPRPVAELAEATETDAGMLYRFLRAAASVGLFAELPDGRFELTEIGTYLRSDVPGSLRYLAHMYGEVSIWNCFGYAIETLRTGKSAGPLVREGKEFFEYMEERPELAEVFHRAMTGTSDISEKIADAYDFSRFAVIADIAGGQGRLLSAILNRNPAATGLLFDQESAISIAGPVLAEHGVADRVETVVGDFFVSIPVGPDAYLLKAIMHDWDDENCVKILSQIRTAIDGKPEGRVFIIDAVVPDGNDWHFSKAMDIAMGVSLGSRERNMKDWTAVLAEAGFELVGTTPTVPPHHIIEARAV